MQSNGVMMKKSVGTAASQRTAGTTALILRSAVGKTRRGWLEPEPPRPRSSESDIARPNTPLSYRESIAHRARHALLKKNAAQGKPTKLRPKARQYDSDPDLITSEEESEDDGW
ncbi:hypothetical protein B0H14DRAFT_3531203 [Mycena olivaceomarginata]|nr:hypothetical protein B0H14DRAFT_3531203 [Mycena olivaceomarginata]